jgi:hypothetical protein
MYSSSTVLHVHDALHKQQLALVMFDTKTMPGANFNPFSEDNVLKLNAVKQYPQDLYFVLRAVLMFRCVTLMRVTLTLVTSMTEK